MTRLFIQCACTAFLCFASSGCALLSKSEPLTPRYFTLVDSNDSSSVQPAAGPSEGAQRLALGRVSAGAPLRERILYRNGDHEVGYYDDRRWTERPDAYLRRALVETLFEKRGLQRVTSGAAPMLQAELVTFEEIRGDQPRVRMQVVITLDDDRTTQLTETITVERPIKDVSGDEQANAVAAAFAEALHAGVAEIADHVSAKLATAEAASPVAVEAATTP